MEFVYVIALALIGAGLIKGISVLLLRRPSPRGPLSEEKKQQLCRLTTQLARKSIAENFRDKLKDIEILELGAFGANILHASLSGAADPISSPSPEGEKPGEPCAQSEKPVTVEPGDDVALTLRWRNTGEKTIRQAVFAVAFLSPSGEALVPDALERDPWMLPFGCAAAARFTGTFPYGQGRQQKDMKNAFLLFHGPVDTAVILGMRLLYEDGTEFTQSVLD